jgi:hypothetical protein
MAENEDESQPEPAPSESVDEQPSSPIDELPEGPDVVVYRDLGSALGHQLEERRSGQGKSDEDQ